MGQHLPESSEERVGGSDIRAVYMDSLADCGITLGFTKAAKKGFIGEERTILAFCRSGHRTVFWMLRVRFSLQALRTRVQSMTFLTLC